MELLQDRTIGTLKDPWVAKQMILSYFSQPVISDKVGRCLPLFTHICMS